MSLYPVLVEMLGGPADGEAMPLGGERVEYVGFGKFIHHYARIYVRGWPCYVYIGAEKA